MQTIIQECPVWITWFNEIECEEMNENEGLSEHKGDTVYEPGYYWAVCFPGCLPESDFHGPFATESEAESDAENSLDY